VHYSFFRQNAPVQGTNIALRRMSRCGDKLK
jgi:hypothetical protein